MGSTSRLAAAGVWVVRAEHPQQVGQALPGIAPHSARIWNYWLGGIDNYAVDREVGDEFAAAWPEIVEIAQADRALLGRAVRYLVGEAGIPPVAGDRPRRRWGDLE